MAKSRSKKALVIVESPAKAKTINKYLGPEYEVKASMGHIRDLPSKGLNVDIENDFEPTYDIMPGKKRTVTALKTAAKGCDELYLATDLVPNKLSAEDTESISLLRVPLGQVSSLIVGGDITDAKSIAGWLLFLEHRKARQLPHPR